MIRENFLFSSSFSESHFHTGFFSDEGGAFIPIDIKSVDMTDYRTQDLVRDPAVS